VIDLQAPIGQVHDRLIRDTGARVEASLALAIEVQARRGDLDDKSGVRRMAQVISRLASDHGHIGLGLGLVIKRHGKLRLYRPARAEGALEGSDHQQDRRGVRPVLRLLHQQLAAEQLDAVFRAQDLGPDEPVVALRRVSTPATEVNASDE